MILIWQVFKRRARSGKWEIFFSSLGVNGRDLCFRDREATRVVLWRNKFIRLYVINKKIQNTLRFMQNISLIFQLLSQLRLHTFIVNSHRLQWCVFHMHVDWRDAMSQHPTQSTGHHSVGGTTATTNLGYATTVECKQRWWLSDVYSFGDRTDD